MERRRDSLHSRRTPLQPGVSTINEKWCRLSETPFRGRGRGDYWGRRGVISLTYRWEKVEKSRGRKVRSGRRIWSEKPCDGERFSGGALVCCHDNPAALFPCGGVSGSLETPTWTSCSLTPSSTLGSAPKQRSQFFLKQEPHRDSLRGSKKKKYSLY